MNSDNPSPELENLSNPRELFNEVHDKFQPKGKIEIILSLGECEKRFRDLDREVDISGTTLSKRLDEMLEEQIVDKKVGSDTYMGDQTESYVLTPRGEFYFDCFQKYDLRDKWMDLRLARKSYSMARDKVEKAVVEEIIDEENLDVPMDLLK